MKIVLIRHSKTKIDPQVPITCWGLSEKGIDLANELSRNEIIKKMKVLYASLQTKSLETAVLLAKPNAIPIKTDDRLTEITSFTKKFITDPAQYEQTIKNFYLNKIDRINDGETKIEALDRFNKTIDEITTNENDKEYIGIVSHGNILTHFSAQFKQIKAYETHKKIKYPDVAVLDWDKKSFIIFFGEII